MAHTRSGKDHGRMLKTSCPHCHSIHFFHLKEQTRPTFFLAIFGVDRSWYMECSGCRFTVDIAAEDADTACELNSAAMAYERGEIDAETLAERTQSCHFAAIDELLEQAETSDCPQCGSAVPVSFSLCWSCSHVVHPEADVLAPDPGEPPASLTVPDPIFGGSPLIASEEEAPRG